MLLTASPLLSINDAPERAGEQPSLGGTQEDATSFSITESQLLNGFSDRDGDELSVTGLTLVSTASRRIEGDAANGWTTSTADFNGPVELIYAISDGSNGQEFKTEYSSQYWLDLADGTFAFSSNDFGDNNTGSKAIDQGYECYWKPSLNRRAASPTSADEIKALSIANEKTAYLYADKNGLLVLDIDGDKTPITSDGQSLIAMAKILGLHNVRLDYVGDVDTLRIIVGWAEDTWKDLPDSAQIVTMTSSNKAFSWNGEPRAERRTI